MQKQWKVLFAGARVKIMRSIQIGNFKPKQSQIHDEHMQKEYQSRPLVNSSARTPTHASASTQDIKGRAEQKLPHRTHLLSDGACSVKWKLGPKGRFDVAPVI